MLRCPVAASVVYTVAWASVSVSASCGVGIGTVASPSSIAISVPFTDMTVPSPVARASDQVVLAT